MDHFRTSRPPRVSSHKTDKSRVSVKSLPAIKTTSLHETRALGLSMGGRHSTTGTPQSMDMGTYKHDRHNRVKSVSFNETLNTVDDLCEEKRTKQFNDFASNVSSETFAKEKRRTPGSQTERPWLHSPDVEVYNTPLSTARSVPVVQWRKISSVPEADVLRDTDDVGGGGGGASGEIDLTRCLSCGEGGRILKLLPCLHSVCQECLGVKLQEHPSRSWFKCDLCSRQIHIPSNGLDGFRDNSYFNISDQSVTENDRCVVCKSLVPSCRCVECKSDLCTDCVNNHLSNDLSKEHYIVNVTKEMVGMSAKETFCEEHHPFTLELYCISCSEPICGRCAIGKHTNHICEDIQTTALNRRNELMQTSRDSSTKRTLRDLRDFVNACKKEKGSVQDCSAKAVKAIQSHIQRLKDEMDLIGQKLVQGVLETEADVVANLGRKMDDGEKKQKAVRTSIETMKKIAEKTRDLDLINLFQELKTAVEDVKSSSKPTPVQCVRMKYKPMFQSIGISMGGVRTHTYLKRTLDYAEACSLSFQKFISSICPIDDSKAWIGFRKYAQICCKDGTLGIRVDMEEPLVAIDTTTSDAVLVACKSSVKAITSKHIPRFLFRLTQEPSDMKISEGDNLIICFKDAKRVAMFSTRGKPLHDFDVRNLGYRFGLRLNDPWKLAIDENQNTYVTDFTSETVGVYDRHGEIKSAISTNVYRNASMCCNRGLLFVADFKRDCVQVLAETGELLQTCQTLGIGSPCSIAVDKAGCLWLGSWTGQVKVYSPR